jgi:hypothetical protein
MAAESMLIVGQHSFLHQVLMCTRQITNVGSQLSLFSLPVFTQ